VEYLKARRGPAVLRRLLDRVADGADIVAAIEGELGESFGAFERNWLRTLRERPPVTIPGTFREHLQLRERSTAEGSGEAQETAADEYMRLGELLRARGLLAAAIAEYEKAELLLGRANPMLQNALAAAQLDLDAPDQALEALEDVVHWHPSYYVSHLNRGAALNALGDAEGAAAALELAGGINPFDPEVHRQLAMAYDTLNRETLADRHRQFAATLHGDR
jgi:predicted Zn-dependent protease